MSLWTASSSDIGRQHHLAVEVGGQLFELVLNSDSGHKGSRKAHTAGTGSSSNIVQQALPLPKVCVDSKHQYINLLFQFCAGCGGSSQTASRHAVKGQLNR